jgi:hypothetical protein
MTSQTKKFIEIPDIIAFRFECLECHAYATIPFNNFQKFPRSCINCGAEWEVAHTSHLSDIFQQLGQVMRDAQRRADSRKITFSLEIKEEAKAVRCLSVDLESGITNV